MVKVPSKPAEDSNATVSNNDGDICSEVYDSKSKADCDSVNLSHYVTVSSLVYKHMHQILLRKVIKEKSLYGQSKALQKATLEDQWCYLPCKADSKELSKYLSKIKRNKPTNGNTHLKSVHEDKLNALKKEEEHQLVERKRKSPKIEVERKNAI